jgi:sulfate/thiosulfate transport system ATP-binding protein
VREELRTWLRRLHEQVHVTTVFVTHDQEEAMDVADRIVVMAGGKVEQHGSPDDLYDRPANDFVMSFLGPVTSLDGQLLRPHDITLVPPGSEGSRIGTVVRVARLGFEVRVELSVDGSDMWAQLTRAQAEDLNLGQGAPVGVRVLAPAALATA